MNERNTELHVVIGAGPLGLSVVNAAVEKGYRVRLVHRSGAAAVPSSVECIAADVSDSRSLLRAVQGAGCIYQCASPPYDRWPQLFPALQRNILSAARSVNARVVIGENLYTYGDTKGEPMTERTPWAAATRKGSVRARMAEEALHEHHSGGVPVAIARGADFFGPGVLQSVLGERAIGAAVRGVRASLTGDMDMPHSFTYIEDFGRAMVALSGRNEAFGECWHVPAAPPVSQREMMERVYVLLRTRPDYSAMGTFMMRLGGLFIQAARETVEMMYQFTQPFIVDASKFQSTFGIGPTPLDEALQRTVEWFRSKYGPAGHT